MAPFGTLKIVLSPDPGLRQVCEPCTPGDKSLHKLAKKMFNTMYKNSGCGLAGPQVGVEKRIVVIDCGIEKEEPYCLVNPEIVALEGDPVTDLEGCLSLPGISVPIKRQPFARVKYFDLDGNECFVEGDGLLGRCLQHELDHLDGITLLESCSPIDRIKAMKEYQEALARGARPGDTE
ncbi:MAG: peptide deformylase [Coriobacteriia bacterium]|nr:peptide deformylase [Coriobacteriia bacterium]